MPRARLPVQPLSVAEQRLIDDVLGQGHGSATDALRCLNRARRQNNIREASKRAVHRYATGVAHKRGTLETRGRPTELSKQNIRRLDQVRRRLIKRANDQFRVTYNDVIGEGGLRGVACQRVCEDAMRAEGVGYKRPHSEIYISDADAQARLRVAKAWAKRPRKYWVENVHAYVDNKAFPRPLTPAQRVRFRNTMVARHLRKPSEGVDRGFTKPREKHSFLGIPSVTTSTVVANDRAIMWHVVSGHWNGTTAAAMCEKHLRPALARTWGARVRYTIVEDGDRKGNKSGKGNAAKARSQIYPITLPPRTPSLMPLDYAIWQAIGKRVIDGAPAGVETKAGLLDRLSRAAKGLPKGYACVCCYCWCNSHVFHHGMHAFQTVGAHPTTNT